MRGAALHLVAALATAARSSDVDGQCALELAQLRAEHATLQEQAAALQQQNARYREHFIYRRLSAIDGADGDGDKDTVVVWRMPLPPTWQQRAYNAFWASGFG